MKKLLLMLLTFFFAYAYAEENFDIQMGKDTPAWKHVQTPEDVQRLEFFRELFRVQAADLKGVSNSQLPIPRVIHFIWLGPEPFPHKSKHRIVKWIERHPKWKFNFWTDLSAEPPVAKMQKRALDQFSFRILGDEYNASENYGEKAKILAYEILLQEGGVYVDHDVFPFKAFDDLNSQFDFYCGLEELAPSILSTSIIPSTHLIGAKPDHPIIEQAAFWLQENWGRLGSSFSGESKEACRNRVLHRSFWALSEGIDRGIGKFGHRDAVFPATYFSGKKRKTNSYAIHHQNASWLDAPSSFEAKMEKKFKKMIKKDDQALMLTFLLAGASFLGSVFLLIYVRKINREG